MIMRCVIETAIKHEHLRFIKYRNVKQVNWSHFLPLQQNFPHCDLPDVTSNWRKSRSMNQNQTKLYSVLTYIYILSLTKAEKKERKKKKTIFKTRAHAKTILCRYRVGPWKENKRKQRSDKERREWLWHPPYIRMPSFMLYMGQNFNGVLRHLLPLYFNRSRCPNIFLKFLPIYKIKEGILIYLCFTAELV